MLSNVKYARLLVDRSTPVFKTTSEPATICVVFKNLNDNRTRFQPVVTDHKGNLLNVPEFIELDEDKEYILNNIYVPANTTATASTNTPGLAAAGYLAKTTANPAMITLKNGESKAITISTEEEGNYVLKVKNKISGISVIPESANISKGGSATFTIMRDSTSYANGNLYFEASGGKVRTSVSVGGGVKPKPSPDPSGSGSGGGGGYNTDDFDVDLVAAYNRGRDSVITW